nr:YetF domain-containing protein [Sulfobacillus harzensis]
MENTHTPLINAIAITVALGVLQWLLTWFNLRFRWLEKITQGISTTLVTNGQIQEDAMRRQRMSKPDLFMELRQNSVKLKDVKEARLEASGKVSVQKKSSSSQTTSSKSGGSSGGTSGESSKGPSGGNKSSG